MGAPIGVCSLSEIDLNLSVHAHEVDILQSADSAPPAARGSVRLHGPHGSAMWTGPLSGANTRSLPLIIHTSRRSSLGTSRFCQETWVIYGAS